MYYTFVIPLIDNPLYLYPTTECVYIIHAFIDNSKMELIEGYQSY